MTARSRPATGLGSRANLIRATWAPIQIEPIPGSGERLTVAIVVTGEDGKGEVVPAERLDALECLFPTAHSRLRFFVDAGLEAAREHIAQADISGWVPPLEGLYLGPTREALGTSLRDIARLWLQKTSSLALHQPQVPAMPVEETEAEPRRSKDRLPLDVFSHVFKNAPELGRFFRSDIQEGRPRRTVDDITIDYQSRRLVANFATIRGESPAVAYNLLKPRLWDIDLCREWMGNGSGGVAFELFVFNDPQHMGRRRKSVEGAMERLEYQAKKKRIRLETFSSAARIAERLMAVEAAA